MDDTFESQSSSQIDVFYSLRRILVLDIIDLFG